MKMKKIFLAAASLLLVLASCQSAKKIETVPSGYGTANVGAFSDGRVYTGTVFESIDKVCVRKPLSDKVQVLSPDEYVYNKETSELVLKEGASRDLVYSVSGIYSESIFLANLRGKDFLIMKDGKILPPESYTFDETKKLITVPGIDLEMDSYEIDWITGWNSSTVITNRTEKFEKQYAETAKKWFEERFVVFID